MTYLPPTDESNAPAGDPVAKAIAMLEMLTPDVREQVLGRMSPEMRERIEARIESTPEGSRPHQHFSSDVMARSQLVRETARRIEQRRVQDADITADELTPSHGVMAPGSLAGAPMPQRPRRSAAAPSDPLSQLATVHPAALARAMQGERAEAWAIVLDRVTENVRAALLMYLDAQAQESIDQARRKQQDLPIQLRATIERAITCTVVPRALREHQMLFTPTPTPPHNGAGYGTAV